MIIDGIKNGGSYSLKRDTLTILKIRAEGNDLANNCKIASSIIWQVIVDIAISLKITVNYKWCPNICFPS